MRYRKATIVGVGTIVMAGIAYMVWKKSANHRARYKSNFKDWKKDKIDDIYYKSLDERDIAWG